jgi:hypothetical protein
MHTEYDWTFMVFQMDDAFGLEGWTDCTVCRSVRFHHNAIPHQWLTFSVSGSLCISLASLESNKSTMPTVKQLPPPARPRRRVSTKTTVTSDEGRGIARSIAIMHGSMLCSSRAEPPPPAVRRMEQDLMWCPNRYQQHLLRLLSTTTTIGTGSTIQYPKQ